MRYLVLATTLTLGCSSSAEDVEAKVDLKPSPLPVSAKDEAATVWTVIVDPSYSQAMVDAVDYAMANWRYPVHESCPFSYVVKRGPTRPYEAQLGNGGLPELRTIEVGVMPADPPDDLGWAHWDPSRERGSWIYLKADPDWHIFWHVIIHEIGHALGLPHAPSGLMAQGNLVWDVGPVEAKAYSALWCR